MKQDAVEWAYEQMEGMSRGDVEKLVLIACNQLGMAISGGKDYKDPDDAIKCFSQAIEWVFNRYTDAANQQDMQQSGRILTDISSMVS